MESESESENLVLLLVQRALNILYSLFGFVC